MKLLDYNITTIEHYPDDGNHQQCNVDEPFCIRKGEDGYTYKDKNGISKEYNLRYTKTGKFILSKNWICHLTEGASESLQEIFNIRENRNLDVILKYCTKLYIRSLKLEIERINMELKQFK